MNAAFIGVGFMLISAAFNSIGAIFFKLASSRLVLDVRKLLRNHHLILGFVFYGFSTLAGLPAYRFAEITLIYPIIATSYIWTCLLSGRYLGERMTWVRWAGIAFIIMGVSFIGFGSA
jgi:drug/metabolite transporter (DMT)-like permease